MTKLAAPDRQTKGERTREHLLAPALMLFAEHDYTTATMRDIATAAQCSLGLIYRYFANKEALVLAWYHQIANTLVKQTATLPAASVADRFVAIMRMKLVLLLPYRTAFGAWFGVVGQATDAPRPQQVQDLALVLDVLHLALIVVWLHDRSPEQHATMQLLELSHGTLRRLRWFLRLPPVTHLLAQLAQALQPLIVSSDTSTVESSHP